MKTVFLLVLIVSGCSISAETTPTYTKDIKPIFKNRCSQCHDYLKDKNWQLYQDAFRHKDKIKEKMLDKTMPMGQTMPQDERDLIVKWVDMGSKE